MCFPITLNKIFEIFAINYKHIFVKMFGLGWWKVVDKWHLAYGLCFQFISF